MADARLGCLSDEPKGCISAAEAGSHNLASALCLSDLFSVDVRQARVCNCFHCDSESDGTAVPRSFPYRSKVTLMGTGLLMTSNTGDVFWTYAQSSSICSREASALTR
jgi:hypothetical protein